MWEDEVRIPPPGYRSAPQRRAAEARRLMLVVGGIAAVLVLGVGGYFVATGSGPEGVPVIQAPATPVKIKPADPGGLDVNAQTSALLGGSGVAGDDNVAPAPEAPDPAALAAAANQEQSSPPPVTPASGAAAPAASPSAVASTAPAPSPAPVAPAAVSVPSIPETAGAPVSPQTAMNVAPPSREAAQVHNLAQEYNPPVERHGHLRVQVAALNSQEAALREWDHLTHRMPSLFARHRPIFEQAHVNGHTYWRVRTAGFASVSEATKFCEDVHAQGGSCTVASF